MNKIFFTLLTFISLHRVKFCSAFCVGYLKLSLLKVTSSMTLLGQILLLTVYYFLAMAIVSVCEHAYFKCIFLTKIQQAKCSTVELTHLKNSVVHNIFVSLTQLSSFTGVLVSL